MKNIVYVIIPNISQFEILLKFVQWFCRKGAINIHTSTNFLVYYISVIFYDYFVCSILPTCLYIYTNLRCVGVGLCIQMDG